MKRRFIQNEEAISISVGAMLTFSISVLVFVAVILSFYTLSNSSENKAMQGSFDILGSGLAVKITTMDTLVNISNSYGGMVNTLEYEFSVPATIANEGYSINVTNSTKQVIIKADNGAIAFTPFNTSSNIVGTTIDSGAQDYKFIYNSTGNTINIGGQ